MVTRLTGLGSGFDVDGVVAKLMTVARMPLDKFAQQKQTLQWQTDDYRTLNASILDLHNTAFNMKLDSSFQTKNGSSSNDSAVSVTATPNATEGVYSLLVNNVAAASTLTSSAGLGGDTTKTLGDAAGINLTADTTLTIGGQKGTATIAVKTTDTIAQLLANINGKSNVTGVKLTYDPTLDRLFFVSSSTGAATKVDLKSQDPTFLGDTNGTTGLKLAGVTTVNTGQTIVGTRAFTNSVTGLVDLTQIADSTLTGSQTKTLRITYQGNNYDDVIDSSKSIGQIIDELNGSDFGKTGASLYLDSAGHLALFNPNDADPITFQDTTSPPFGTDIVTTLGLNAATTTSGTSYTTVNTSAAYKTANATTNSVAGVDADITFNGVHGTYSTNTFTVAGMSLTVKSASATPVSLTVTQDVDTVFNNIKAFVDKYNTTIAAMNEKVDEVADPNYPPLTDTQKASMKDDDITSWTAKARVGMLHNDTIISTALSNMRRGVFDAVSGIPSGDLSQLFQIGITTGPYQEQGQLHIDETKLRDAIATNPDEVQKLFSADDGSTTSDDSQGIAVRLVNLTQNVITQINNKAGTTTSLNANFLLGSQMNDIDQQVSDLTSKLNDLQTQYYNQFDAMDNAISQMNAQMASLQSMLGTKN